MTRTSIIVLCVLVLPRLARAECPATAVLDGDGGLVDSIDASLKKRGVATKATANCPITMARLARRDNAIAVTITDPSGRRSTRTLDDVDAAAALIETWARQDMNAMALQGWVEATPEAVALVVPAPSVDVVAASPSSSKRVRDPVSFSVAAEASVGLDGTRWTGGRGTACVRIGPLCAGVTGRIATNDPRRTIDVLAGVELPVTLGARLALLTGVGVGAGSFRWTYSRGEQIITDSVSGARIDAHASLVFSFSRYVGLHAGVSAGGSPQAPFTYDTSGDMPLDNAEPKGFVRADIGLQIGVP